MLQLENGVVVGATNAILSFYQDLITTSQMSHSDFAQYLVAGERVVLEESLVRNHMGTILNRIGMGVYDEYLARILNLELKIELFNLAIAQLDTQQILSSFVNRYYPESCGAYLSSDKKSICFDGPIETKKGFRCLRITI